MGDIEKVGAAVKAEVKTTLELASRCAGAESSDNYGLLEDQVGELEGVTRQAFQSEIDFGTLLPKLQQMQPLTSGDWKNLELLMVGDADSYLKYETEFEHWKTEVGQLMGEIGKLESASMDLEGLMHLRAVCQELRGVLPDIVNYLDAKERTAKFQQARQGPIDAEGYRVLAEIVDKMLSSQKK
jgi:hypothetical protein